MGWESQDVPGFEQSWCIDNPERNGWPAVLSANGLNNWISKWHHFWAHQSWYARIHWWQVEGKLRWPLVRERAIVSILPWRWKRGFLISIRLLVIHTSKLFANCCKEIRNECQSTEEVHVGTILLWLGTKECFEKSSQFLQLGNVCVIHYGSLGWTLQKALQWRKDEKHSSDSWGPYQN